MTLSKILFQDPFISVVEGIIPDITLAKMLAETEYEKSSGYDNNTSSSQVTDYRTSSTFFAYAKYEYVTDYVLSFLKEDLGHEYDRTLAESWQLTKYEVGEYYKPHWDYFLTDFETSDGRKLNRTGSFIIYLNDDFAGGETHFPKIDLTIQPKAGKCLYFTYPGGPGNASADLTFHEAKPVISGTKTIASLWLRAFK